MHCPAAGSCWLTCRDQQLKPWKLVERQQCNSLRQAHISEAAFAEKGRQEGGVLPAFLACIRFYSTDRILNITIMVQTESRTISSP
jgi:hypothetical protein